MNIGMIVNNLEVSGGYQKLVIRLAQQLTKKGHKVTTYTVALDRKKCYPNDIKSLKIIEPDSPATASLNVRFAELAKKIGNKYDALIIHDDLSLMAIANLPKSNQAKVVWMLNNQLPDDIGRFAPDLKSIIKQKQSLKDKRTDLKNGLGRISSIRQGLKRVNAFVTYDEFNKKLVKDKLKRKATVVFAGADLDRFKVYAKSRSFKNKPRYRILSVGVVFPHRRYEDLIPAIGKLRDKNYAVTATIVGLQDLSPEYFKYLKDLTIKLKLEKYVDFKHYVTDKEMVKLYKDSDAFAFINDGFTWGIAAFEAVAAKLPTIITNNIGAADLIKNGKTGWVVRPKSPTDVAKAIAEIIDNRKKTEKITNRAFNELTEFLTWDSYTDRMLEVIKKLK